MIRMFRPLALAGLSLAAFGAARAQPPQPALGDNSADSPSLNAPATGNASDATSLKAGVIPAPKLPNVAPPVTVTGRPLKPCRARDQACIDQVSAEIWRRYPKEIQTLCTQEEMHRFQQGFTEQALGFTGELNNQLTPAARQLCDYGSRMKKRQQVEAAAAPAQPEDH